MFGTKLTTCNETSRTRGHERRMHDNNRRKTKNDHLETDWNVRVKPIRRSASSNRRSSNPTAGTMITVVCAMILHGALGYFGYRWIRSQSTPIHPAAEHNLKPGAKPGQYPPTIARNPLAPKEEMTGKLHWSRRDGMSVKPGPQDDWKLAGGYFYSTTASPNGSTIIELVEESNRPVRCKG